MKEKDMELGFKVTEIYRKNEEFFNDDNIRMIVNRGSTRSSKTYSIIQLLIVKALTPNPKLRKSKPLTITIIGETLPKIKKTVLKDFKEIMGDAFYILGDFNKSEMVYTFKNNAVIQFVSGDAESKFRGMKQDILFVDEINTIKEEVFTQLSIRTIDKIVVAFNPTSKFHITEMVEGEDDVVDYVSTYQQNPFLEDAVIKEIEKRSAKDENFRRVFALGEYGSLEGVIFKENQNWEMIDELPQSYDKVLYGSDYGFSNDPTTLLRVQIVGNSLFVQEVYYKKGKLNREIAKEFKEYNPDNHKIIADSSTPSFIAELKKIYALNITGVDKSIESILEGIENIKERYIYVTKDSTNLITELRNYQWDEKKKDSKGNIMPIDNHNHAIDALRYVVSTHYRARSKKPIKVRRV
jgi:phage terminase large subunit